MDYYELALQRRQHIEEGLLELLQTDRYEKITVTDIAGHMGISRKSFYKYFSDKDDCLQSLFDRVIQEAALHVASCPVGEEDAYGTWLEYLRFWKGQNVLLDTVEKQNFHRLLLRRNVHYILTEERHSQSIPGLPEDERDEDVLWFYLTGILAVLLAWSQRGFTPGVEEMARKCQKLCHL